MRPSARSRATTLALALLALATPAFAQQPAPRPVQPVRVPTAGGAAVSPDSATHRVLYADWHFAPARVEGSLVYVSGIVAGTRDSVPLDVAGLEASFRRAWVEMRRTLEAAGSSTGDIVELVTFHVFGNGVFRGTKREHIEAFRRVKDEFVPAPYPAWTGIGVAELFPDRGVVEIRVVAWRKDAAR